jgi:pyruvate ferredoxin oxidoreductase gamma subunit
MYRIRFHGRGGQGIKTAANILGSAFFLEGFEVQDAPRYGAERRGAPIFAYVRADRAPIHERGVIDRPDLVIVADDTLVPVPTAGVLQGVGPATVLLIASAAKAEAWKDRLKFAGTVLTLPDRADLADAAEMPLVGAACAGAAARLCDVIRLESLRQAIRNELAGHDAVMIGKTLERASTAFDAMAAHAGLLAEGTRISAQAYVSPEWIDVPSEDTARSAPDVRAPANSVLVKTGVWRTLRPVIDYDRCNRCSWVCSTLCPDSAITVDPDHTPRIDYDHCKGCMVCVAVCPPHAIGAIPEPARSPEEAPR